MDIQKIKQILGVKNRVQLKLQSGGRTPIVGTPQQYQAYQDSLFLYNKNKELLAGMNKRKYSLQQSEKANLNSRLSSLRKSADGELPLNYITESMNLKNEGNGMYSLDDYASGIIDRTLPRQYFKEGIMPKGFNVFSQNILGTGFGDKRVAFDYSNVKPVQPIIYQPTVSTTVGDVTGDKIAKSKDNVAVLNSRLVLKDRPKDPTLQLNQGQQLLPESSKNINFNPIPYEQEAYFSRPRQQQEIGGTEYFDKKTGKPLGKFQGGGRVLKDKFNNPIKSKLNFTADVRSNYDHYLNQINLGQDYKNANKEEKDNILAHEGFHEKQYDTGKASYPEYFKAPFKKPNLLHNDDMHSDFYNRKSIEVNMDIDRFNDSNPSFNFIPRDLIYDKVVDYQQYNNPYSMEGEAQRYQETGKFQNGGSKNEKQINTIEGNLYSKILMNRNKNLDFVQRANAVGQYPESNMFNQFDPNEFGQKNSHLMSWGEDENGQAYISPNIFNDKNEAIKIPNQYADYISSIGYKNATGISTKQNGGTINNFQDGGSSSEDSLRHQAGKTMDYEFYRGSANGTGLSNYGNPKLNNPTRGDAVNWYMKNIAPQLGMFQSAMEKGEAGDFLYNSGKDVRPYAIQEHLKQIDPNNFQNWQDSEGKYKDRKDSTKWDSYWGEIQKLPENQRRQLINKGRDFYYKNINNPTTGVPNDAYYKTWYGRIWNTNDYKEFSPNNPNFTPKKQNGGSINKFQGGGSVKLTKEEVLRAIQWAEEANRSNKYEPTQAVKNTKAALSSISLIAPAFLPARIGSSIFDLGTATKYALDGQYDKAAEDVVQAGLNWIPFLKQKNMINLSKNTVPLAYRFNQAIPYINQVNTYTNKANDVKTISEVYSKDASNILKEDMFNTSIPVDNLRVQPQKRKIVLQDGGNFGIIPTVLSEVEVVEHKPKNYLPQVDNEFFTKDKCSTTNCSEYTTTALANILGVSRSKLDSVAGDAWYKRDKVLKNNGEDVWDKNGKGEINYDTLKAGDFVSLTNNNTFPSAYSTSPPTRGGVKKEEGARHSGIIVGKDINGIPIVEHNIHGTLRREPIVNIKGYEPLSIFRAAEARDSNLESYKGKVSKYYNIKGQEEVPIPFNKPEYGDELYDSYAKNRQELSTKYQKDYKFIDKAFANIYGIASQESKIGNDLPIEDLHGLASQTKQAIQEATPEWVNKVGKQVKQIASKALHTDEKKAQKSKWEKEIEVTNMVAKNGVTEAQANQIVNEKYGTYYEEPVTAKSKGIFKQKDISNRFKEAYNYEDLPTKEKIKMENWGKDPFSTLDGQVKNVYGLYIENFEKAKKIYPNENEDFYHQIATIAHNNPTKAFNQKFANFYLKGIGNPNFAKYKVDYLEKVKEYQKKLTNSNEMGSTKILQDGGMSQLGYKEGSPYEKNPFNLINSNQITMKGVTKKVIGISDTGEMKVMNPNEEHSFSGTTVMEFPKKTRVKLSL